MASVEIFESSDALPATRLDTRDEKALPRSVSGIKRINPMYDDDDDDDDDGIIELNESMHLNDTNWVEWRVRMIPIFRVCKVVPYVKGTLPCPDPNVDPKGARNWSDNDIYAQLIIFSNVTHSQRENISFDNAHELWTNLELVHSSRTFNKLLANRRNLFHTTAREGDDIVEHLKKLKEYRLETNFVAYGNKRLKISEDDFNLTIAQSLPHSWDHFTDRYVGSPTFFDDDPGAMISSEQFIKDIEQEYRQRKLCDREYYARKIITTRRWYCRLCKKRNHSTDDCRFLGQARCGGCGRFGHDTGECRRNNRGKKRKYED